MGFKIIDYNKCTFNKIIHGEQCAIQFHVDNLKLSYMEQGVLDKIINALNDIFGSEGDMLAALYGSVYKYLGMTINWSEIGRVIFSQCIIK